MADKGGRPVRRRPSGPRGAASRPRRAPDGCAVGADTGGGRAGPCGGSRVRAAMRLEDLGKPMQGSGRPGGGQVAKGIGQRDDLTRRFGRKTSQVSPSAARPVARAAGAHKAGQPASDPLSLASKLPGNLWYGLARCRKQTARACMALHGSLLRVRRSSVRPLHTARESLSGYAHSGLVFMACRVSHS
jgi:hypothetical protein